MDKRPRWAGMALALWTGLQITACGEFATEPIGEDTPPEEESPVVLSVDSVSDLYPGQDASLYGQNLDLLTEITADGEAVQFQVISDSEATFQVPEAAQACMVDGRPVEVVVNSQHEMQGALRAENALRLEIGESRVLSAEDLQCLQVPAGIHDYVLSVANFSQDLISERVMDLHKAAQDASASFDVNASVMGSGDVLAAAAGDDSDPSLAASTDGFGEPFDDYATAQVGDTLRFVDWSSSQRWARQDATTKEEVPSYDAIVVAAEENQLVVIDLRVAEYLASGETATLPSTVAEYIEEHGDKIADEAALANEHAVPAIRAVLGQDFSPPEHGAGGRMVTVLTEMRAGGGISTFDLKPEWAWASGMMLSYANILLGRHVGDLAGTIIHEQAHLADRVLQEYPDAPIGIGWYAEGVAELVVDVAARMDAGSLEQADPEASRIHARTSAAQDASADRYSPWGRLDGDAIAFGPYNRGARILRYAQQLIADDGNPMTLHERLRAKAPDNGTGTPSEWYAAWHINAIAAEVGLTAEELLEQSMIADLTDDLIPAEAVERFAVPQVEGWKHGTGQGSRVAGLNLYAELVARQGHDFNRTFDVPAGGYAYVYIHPGADEGISLEGENVQIEPHQAVGVIRLR